MTQTVNRSPARRRVRPLRLLGVVLLWLLGLTLLALLVAAVWFRERTLPVTAGQLLAPGLSAPVTVTRDAHGVPHIRAERDTDAIFALGFVHAQDRAWQMDFQRRVAQGRLAEVLGEAALPQDRFLRTMGFQAAAESALAALSPQSRAAVRAYTAGVNAGLSQGRLAPEFLILGYRPEPWREVDSVSWSKLMAYDLGGNYEQEIRNAGLLARGVDPETVKPPFAGPTIVRPGERELPQVAGVHGGPQEAAVPERHLPELGQHLAAARALALQAFEGKGSNNWVVHGSKTASGAPLLADDPHLAMTAPMLWYLADLQGDRLNAIGATIPGLPAVVIGRNADIAWGVTNLGPDVQDLYRLSPEEPLRVRREVIRVKGGADVVLDVQESRYGPVVSDVLDVPAAGQGAGPRTALRWTALEAGDTTMDAFLGINYARDWNEFRAAMSAYVAPIQSFVYADRAGNIGYLAWGRVPVRRGYDGTLPADPAQGHDWVGTVPLSGMPQLYNPARGFVASANNAPLPAGEAPFLGGPRGWAEGYRAARIEALLEPARGLTVADMARLQMDTFSLPWAELRPLLLAVPREGLPERDAQALALLEGWNGHTDPGLAAPAVFEAWLRQLARAWGEDYSVRAVAAALRACAPDCPQLQPTLSAAVESVAGRLGGNPNTWQYGELHQAVSAHRVFGEVPALNRLFSARIPAGGGSDTVNVARPAADDLSFTHAASYRHVVDLGNPDASLYIGTLGQSGNPLSRHARDQQARWAAGDYLPMSQNPRDWGNVQTLTLRPR